MASSNPAVYAVKTYTAGKVERTDLTIFLRTSAVQIRLDKKISDGSVRVFAGRKPVTYSAPHLAASLLDLTAAKYLQKGATVGKVALRTKSLTPVLSLLSASRTIPFSVSELDKAEFTTSFAAVNYDLQKGGETDIAYADEAALVKAIQTETDDLKAGPWSSLEDALDVDKPSDTDARKRERTAAIKAEKERKVVEQNDRWMNNPAYGIF